MGNWIQYRGRVRANELMGNGHTCQCRKCKPSAYPQGERLSRNHYAVRLGDAPTLLRVLLDSVDVTNDTKECIAGDEGHVWMLAHRGDPTTFHLCTCGNAVCEIERMGKVEVLPKE